MSSDIALQVHDLSKHYTIRHMDHDHATLAQAALHRIRHPRGGRSREEFCALRDVSFEVPRGQILGVIGHNGAGKSTLLKILSRITPPTGGRVEVFGRIGSLLEVGTGFHSELTGRENIFLNGSILGMKTREIDRQFDAIVQFAQIEQFLDTPVKRYSSGMYVRLAFAVAAHLDCDILLLDEVLAVGDPDFQQRSVAQIKRMASDGRTVLFVSHNYELIAELTTNAIAFDRGSLVDSGPSMDVLERQHRVGARNAGFIRQLGSGKIHRFIAAAAHAHRSAGDLVTLQLDLYVESSAGCDGWRPNFTLRSSAGVSIGSTFGPPCPRIEPTASAQATIFSDPIPLAPGTYSVDLSLSTAEPTGAAYELADLVMDACTFRVPDLRDGVWAPEWGFLNLRTHSAEDGTGHQIALLRSDQDALTSCP